MTGEEASLLRALRRRHMRWPSQLPRTTSASATATPGPNTGGMGAYSPAPVMTPAMVERTMAEIIRPTRGGDEGQGHIRSRACSSPD